MCLCYKNDFYRYFLNPTSYDEALADCDSRSETLVAPENLDTATNLFPETPIASARLNAVADETCFKDADGSEAEIDSLLENGYLLDVPEAESSGLVATAQLGDDTGNVIVLNQDQELATICTYGKTYVWTIHTECMSY